MADVTRRQFVGKLAGLVAAAKAWAEVPHAPSRPSAAHTEKMRRLRELEAVESAKSHWPVGVVDFGRPANATLNSSIQR